MIGDTLRLFADETRLRVVHLLEREPLTVAELQQILDLGQSSISGHLAKLKQAGFILDLAEGPARRYRLREDADEAQKKAWQAIKALSYDDGIFISDAQRLENVRSRRGLDWVERVAGSLHREYAPGRTWDSLCHGLMNFAHFGRCVDVGAGDGALATLLAPHCSHLVCVDPSPAMVKAGQERVASAALTNVTFITATGEDLPLPDASADAVLFLQSLQYVAHPEHCLATACRLLVPGGRLLVLTLSEHDHSESEAFGHRHRGFSAATLQRWTHGLQHHASYTLPPEMRMPRFQTLVFSAIKPLIG